MEDRELNQARSKPDTVDRPLRTAHTFVHHYNSIQYCNTEIVFSIFPFLQTNITSQMWPSGGKKGSEVQMNMFDTNTTSFGEANAEVSCITDVITDVTDDVITDVTEVSESVDCCSCSE